MDMGKQKMMEGKKAFQRELLQIAVPVTLQCLMQSSFSVVDQIMIGQLGSISIAGIGLGGKFASIYSVVAAAFGKYYVLIFRVEDDVRQMTGYVLTAYALVAPVKVQNMILGGILRSGGRTTFVMIIDMIGTWIFGVPLGLLTAFVFHLPIASVYFVLSMEECVRLIISLVVFRKKKWMQTL